MKNARYDVLYLNCNYCVALSLSLFLFACPSVSTSLPWSFPFLVLSCGNIGKSIHGTTQVIAVCRCQALPDVEFVVDRRLSLPPCVDPQSQRTNPGISGPFNAARMFGVDRLRDFFFFLFPFLYIFFSCPPIFLRFFRTRAKRNKAIMGSNYFCDVQIYFANFAITNISRKH